MKKYKKTDTLSYSLGGFPTLELIKHKPDLVNRIVFSTKMENSSIRNEIESFCNINNVPYETNDKIINSLNEKENCYVVGFFLKKDMTLENDKSHVVLVNPSNMGNAGSIIRTILGFGINNLAIINPSIDIADPKVIRASMGAIFSINCEYFDSFEEYQNKFTNHDIYTFMLKGKKKIRELEINSNPYSLVFGNEASGLADDFLDKGTSVVIEHTDKIDSLNLTIAIGIASYEFYEAHKSKNI